MSMESLETELSHVSHVETKEEGNILLHKENRVLIEESGKKEVNILAEDSKSKDAVGECPAPKRIHTFYMPKYHFYDGQKIEVQLDQAEKKLKKWNQDRFQVTRKLSAKQAELAELNNWLMTSYDESKLYRQIIDEKRKEIRPLHHVLGKLRNSNTGGREMSFICSSEEELNDVIKILAYRIQDERIPPSEAKEIIMEIKQLEGTREKVIADAVVRAKIEYSLGEKEAIQDQVKLIGSGLDEVRKEKEVADAKLDQFDKEKKAIEEAIKALQNELKTLSADRQKIAEKSRELRRQLDKENASYYQNRETLMKARKFATSKNIEGLRDLANTEVETFMSSWSSNEAFRDDYETRISRSLSMRGLSRDGRTRNIDELISLVEEHFGRPIEIIYLNSSKLPF